MTGGDYTQQALQARFDAITARFDRIEEYLVSLGQVSGKPYLPYADSLDIPPEVMDLLREGKRLQAVALYRRMTGGSVQDAERLFAGL